MPLTDAWRIPQEVYGGQFYGMRFECGDVLRVWYHDEWPSELARKLLSAWTSARSITILYGVDSWSTAQDDTRTGVDYVVTLADVDDMMRVSLV